MNNNNDKYKKNNINELNELKVIKLKDEQTNYIDTSTHQSNSFEVIHSFRLEQFKRTDFVFLSLFLVFRVISSKSNNYKLCSVDLLNLFHCFGVLGLCLMSVLYYADESSEIDFGSVFEME